MAKFLFAGVLALFALGSAQAFGTAKQQVHSAQSATASAAHQAHLHRALLDIQKAEVAGKAGKLKDAERDTAAAMDQIRQAMGHHQNHSHLRKHHSHLEGALKDLALAEKQFQANKIGSAEKDLEKAC